MPNENYGLPSKCQVYLENLNKKENFLVNIDIYDLKYDFASDTLESFYKVKTLENAKSEYKSFFSFPCLYLENKVSRKSKFSEETSNEMYEYELMNFANDILKNTKKSYREIERIYGNKTTIDYIADSRDIRLRL